MDKDNLLRVRNALMDALHVVDEALAVSAPPARPEPAAPPPAEKPATLEDARRAVLAYAQAKGSTAAGVLLRARFSVDRVSDLKTAEQFAKVFDIFSEAAK